MGVVSSHPASHRPYLPIPVLSALSVAVTTRSSLNKSWLETPDYHRTGRGWDVDQVLILLLSDTLRSCSQADEWIESQPASNADGQRKEEREILSQNSAVS